MSHITEVLMLLIVVVVGVILLRRRNSVPSATQSATTVADQEQAHYAILDAFNRVVFWCVVLFAHAVLFVPAFVLEPLTVTLFGLIEETKMGWWVVSVVLMFLLNANPSSWAAQQQGFVGGKSAFGKLWYQTSPGLIYTLWGIFTHESAECRLKNLELPIDLPERYAGTDEEKVLRMTSAHAKEVVREGAQDVASMDPLSTGRLTLEVTIPVEYSLDNSPGAWRQYVNRIGSEARLLQIVDDRVVGSVRQEVVNHTPSEVFAQWKAIEASAGEEVDDLSRNCGIHQIRVRVKGFDLPHRVNEALADRTTQHTNVERDRLAGLGSKLKDTLTAEGKLALEQVPLRARIDQLRRAKMRSLGLTNEQALQLAQIEVMGTSLTEANYSLIPRSADGTLEPATFGALMDEGRRASSTNVPKVKITYGHKDTEDGGES